MPSITALVDDRLAEGALPPSVADAFRDLMRLAERVERDGEDDDWLSWLTGAEVADKIGEYVLGADPASSAARIRDAIRALVARTWASHPDYDPRWERALRGL